jgi:hypothetical protein
MKKEGYGLAIADLHGVEALSIYNNGTLLQVEVKANKGNKMHKKFHDLLSLAYQAWKPERLEHGGKAVDKSFERFRKDITIMLGHYYASVGMAGEVVLDAKQINFTGMSAEEFDRMYEETLNIIKGVVLVGDRSWMHTLLSKVEDL